MKRLSLEALRGGGAAENAAALERILGGEPHPATDALVLNAAAALVVFDGSAPRQATDRVREALASGAATAKLRAWREAATARKSAQATAAR